MVTEVILDSKWHIELIGCPYKDNMLFMKVVSYTFYTSYIISNIMSLISLL